MDILYRTSPPAYKGCAPPSEKRGLLSGFWCYLFGGGSAPAYRTLNGRSGSAASAAQRCWWQAFPPTPAYKPAPEPDLEPASDEPADPAGEPGADCECAADEDDRSGDVPPDDVYVWTE